MKLLSLLLVFTLTGCASFWEGKKPIEAFDEAKLDQMPLLDVCYETWRLNGKKRLTVGAYEQALDYIQSKGVPEAEIDLARTGYIRIGGSECSLYLARGKGIDRNITTTRLGTRKQHVYRKDTSSNYYVYTDNGVITAIQQ